jgi:hypothetical protein
MKFTSVLILALTLTISANAKVLQEGWYQVLLGNQHIGYVVQRYVFDENKKEFKVVSFTKTNALGGDLTSSLTANCDSGFAPLSYQSTTQTGKTPKLIDAVFKKDSMTAKITENGQTKTVQDKIKKGTFLSNFLIYMILNNKAGLKTGNSFDYNAIAEEDAETVKGHADVNEMEKVNGKDAYKILNDFKGVKYVNHVTHIGEVIDTKQPTSGIQMIAATKEQATKGFPSSEKLLKTLFGTLPKDNALAVATTKNEIGEVTPKEAPTKKLPVKTNENP